jgi:dicarboxylate transporter 10
MCADGVKPPAQKYHYPNALSGMLRIAKDEGLRAFSKGLGPNVVRSVLMSMSIIFIDLLRLTSRVDVSQIAVYVPFEPGKPATNSNRYADAKRRLLSNSMLKMSDGIPTHIIASLAAGTVATTVCAPADVIKSRLQSATSENGRRNVRSFTPSS